MPPVGFKPTIAAGERPQTYALDRAATGIGIYIYIYIYKLFYSVPCYRVFVMGPHELNETKHIRISGYAQSCKTRNS